MPTDASGNAPSPQAPGSSEEALRLALSRGGHRNILVIAHDFPPACNQPGLHVTFLGPIGHVPRLRCASAALHDCPDPADLPARLLTIARETTRRHTLAYIDSDHRAAAILRQVEAMGPLCTPDAWWVFDDAVPPSPGMASAEPSQGWWVGQVFALPSLLEPVADGAAAAVFALPPTGIAFFQGWRLPGPARLAERLAALPAHPDAADIARLSALPGAPAVEHFLGTPPLTLPHAGPLDCAGEGGRMMLEELEPETPASAPFAPLGIAQARAEPIAPPAPPAAALHGSTLVEYHDVVVTGFDTLFFGNTLISRYRDPAQRQGQAWRLAQQGAWGFDPSWPVQRDPVLGLTVNAPALAPAGEIAEPVFWGTPDEGANWGMWLLLALASVELFRRHRDRYAKFYCWCPLPWQKDFLAAAGIAPEELLAHEAQSPWLLRQVGLLEQSQRDLAVTPFLRQALDGFLARQGLLDLPAPHRRLFVSRLSISRRGAYRALLGEERLHEAMLARGFEIVEPETLSLPDQARLFREAACVVGLGGAGMFNTVFCRPGTKVITLEGTGEFAPWHLNMFASAGLEAGLILGEEDPTDPSPHQKRWTLELDQALAALDRMLG